MFFVVGTWLFNTIYFTFISFMFTDTFSTQYIAPSINFLTCVIASSSNVFILFACRYCLGYVFEKNFDIKKLEILFRNSLGTHWRDQNNLIDTRWHPLYSRDLKTKLFNGKISEY